MSAVARAQQQLLLGEWACLGILYPAPSHGFAIAARLKPDGDIGRVWSLSRALTYRSLDQLTLRGLVHPIGVEPGSAGPNRTIRTPTRRGRAELRRWLHSPVPHLRDLRSELLLKLVLAELCGINVTDMIAAQRLQIERLATVLAHAELADDGQRAPDVVGLWRHESSRMALRFLDRLAPE